MSMPLINFESSRKKEQQRQWEREARQAILEKAKNKYEAEQWRQEEARQRGEHSWMLPSVESRLQSTHTSKKKKKEKKKKKKKEKKAKKKKSDSSSSSNDTDDEDVWVEKSASPSTPGMAEGNPKPVPTPSVPTPPQPQDPQPTEKPVRRDEWMEMTSLFGTYSREQMREREGTSRKKQKEEEERKKREAEKPGSHARELNPYFRDGGTGLPEERSCETVAGPGMNAEWLRRSMKRAQEQAQQEKRPLAEIAAERWGSLEKYNELLAQAEGQERKREESRQRKERERRSRSRERQRTDERESKRGSEDYGRRKNEKQESDDERGSRRRSRGRDNESNFIHDKRRSRSRRRERKRSRSKERRRHRRHSNSSRSSSSNSSGNSSSSSRSGSRRSKDDQGRGFNSDRRPRVQGLLKPVDDFRSAPKQSSLATRFLKPGEAELNRSFLNVMSRDSSKSGQGWKKQEFRDQPKQSDPQPSRRAPSSSSSSSATSCTSSESEDEAKEDAVPRKSMHNTDKAGPSTSIDGSCGGSSSGTTPAAQPLGPLLNDREMNELAAKIMKAELIGNEGQANKLKAKLEMARAARANSSQSEKTVEGEAGVTEQVVVLTRMDNKGICRPVMNAGGGEEWGGRRKKKHDTRTHGRDGQRARYFPDDDARDLKSMFEQEKGTTAEDQNSLFEDVVKGAGERLDEEYDLDDMFMSKIATKDTTAKQAERDRLKAIQEHKRSERSLESCRWCFDNKEMPKHLIVALGTKCYVCLPPHQSLTPGHCLIVPIHHVPCAVQADEDLWAEIQNFRKSLVKMFSSRDEDCVFFETVKRLRHFPHMAIICVPLPKEVGEMAPMYFKKAILECEQEWAQNKKLVDLKNRNVRSSVPRGLPYFFVDFGMDSGFAHVIEDEQDFPNHFAQEIVGGMLDLDKNLWRKPCKESFDYQRRKVMEFSKWYKEFDPTQEDKE